MRRRKRRGGAWLPLVGTVFGDGQPDATWFNFTAEWPSGTTPGTGDRFRFGSTPEETVGAFVLTQDDTPDVDNPDTGSSLRDFVEGQEYVLDRVVGKVYCGFGRSEGEVLTAIVCCGLAVLPVDDGAPTTPAMNIDDYDPLLARNAQAPWLWRRTWLLSNNAQPNLFPYSPETNQQYGSVLDGPHLDTRGTKRRIRKEQRIFLVASAQVRNFTQITSADPSFIDFTVDLRLFGSMRKAKNISTFK